MVKPTIKKGPSAANEPYDAVIREISGPGGTGALISATAIDGVLYIDLYRLSPNTVVRRSPRVPEWTTIEQAKRAYPEWFSQSAMRFFSSRVCDEMRRGGFFITSEKGPDDIRRYSVRQIHRSDGRPTIRNVGKFREHETLYAARKAARIASAEWEEGRDPR